MEALDYENSNSETSPSSSESGSDNINEVIVPSLLPEIITDILSRLPIEDVIRYKIVSKEWCALTKDPHFVDMHLRRSLCLPRRLILEPKVKRELVSNLCLIANENGMWRGRDIPIENMPGKFQFTICSCHGFLCVASSSSKKDPLFIYNPILRECVELPNTDIDVGNSSISVGFGYDPINKKYKLVRLFTFFDINFLSIQIHMKGEIITLGEASWRELEVPHISLCNTGAKSVFLDDALHWIIDSDRSCDGILILDISSEKFQTVKIPSSVRRSIRFPNEVFLLNLGGSLALIEHGYCDRFYTWRIARANTKTGYKFYQSFYHMTIAYKHLIWSIKLEDKRIDNSFLFHVSRSSVRSERYESNHFALYYPEQDEHRIVDVSGIPKFFEPTLFIPCLISPCAALGNRDQTVKLN